MNKNPIITIPTSQDYSVWYNEPYYVDKTYVIKDLKGALKRGSALFFARPRRWGKSLFLSTMKHFFDQDLFKEEYFSDKQVWQDEELRKRAGTYMTISLDLKPVYDVENNALNLDNLYERLLREGVISKYLEIILIEFYGKKLKIEEIGLLEKIKLIKENFSYIGEFIKYFTERFSEKENILILIDEYDKPVNDCLKNKKNEAQAQQILEDLKSKLYRYLKDIPAIIVVTGVNKLSMSSFFSDFNNLRDYSRFTNLGFTKKEVTDLFSKLGIEYSDKIEKWYNGYYFKNQQEFNPWASTSFLENQDYQAYWAKTGTSPQYFRYLVTDVLKINDLNDWLNFLKKEEIEFRDQVISLDFINEMNENVIAHYFYYAGLLSYNEYNNKFFIPNNDVLESYQGLIFPLKYTPVYTKLKTKLVEMLEQWVDSDKIADFIKYLIVTKYNNLDKPNLTETVLVSDIALLIEMFSRSDVQREVNILTGRTDLEFIDVNNKKNVVEFKLVRKGDNYEQVKQQATEQLDKYLAGGEYDQGVGIIIDVEAVEVEIEINN